MSLPVVFSVQAAEGAAHADWTEDFRERYLNEAERLIGLDVGGVVSQDYLDLVAAANHVMRCAAALSAGTLTIPSFEDTRLRTREALARERVTKALCRALDEKGPGAMRDIARLHGYTGPKPKQPA